MPDPINMVVQEDESVSLSPEELRVVNAVSPEATVVENDDGAEIVIKDLKNGITRAQIYNGQQGPQGPKGDKGDIGAQGPQGEQGEKGDTGATGPQGIQGPKGDTGPAGAKGDKGDTGDQGPQGIQGVQGPKGDKGDKGDTGATGAQGPKGDKGDTGATGPQGIQGETGATGPTGQAGPAGVDGTTFTPSVSADGDLSWSNDGGKTNPPTVNIKGATGTQGPPGEKGDPGDDYVLTAQDKEDIAGMVDAPVQDVQVNGVSILDAQGVANVPKANADNFGVVKVATQGVALNSNNVLQIVPASLNTIKSGVGNYNPISPQHQHESTFYGLAKAAGDTTQSASSNTVGTYTDTAIDKIMQMLGIDVLIGPHEGTTAAAVKSIGDVFIYSGKLYKATSGIAYGEAIVPGTNCAQTNLINLIRGM